MINLNAFTVAGTDQLHPGISKPLLELPKIPNMHLFDVRLQEEEESLHEWQISTLVGIHKVGPGQMPKGYRPVSLTCLLTKHVGKQTCKQLVGQCHFSITLKIRGRNVLLNETLPRSVPDSETVRLESSIVSLLCLPWQSIWPSLLQIFGTENGGTCTLY